MMPQSVSTIPRLAIFGIALLLPCFAEAQGGRLTIGDVVRNGDTMTVPISLSVTDDVGIAAMDFHLRYDPAVFEPIQAEAGAAAAAAGKQVRANAASPGEYVVLMFGLNQETLNSGDIATLSFRVKKPPADGSSLLQLKNITLSLPNATDIPAEGNDFNVEFESASDPDEKEETPPEENAPEPEQPPVAPTQPETTTPTVAPPITGGGAGGSPSSAKAPERRAAADDASQAARSNPRKQTSPSVKTNATGKSNDGLRASLPAGGVAEEEAKAPTKTKGTSEPKTPAKSPPKRSDETMDSAAKGDQKTADTAVTSSEESASPAQESASPAEESQGRKRAPAAVVALAIAGLFLAGILALRKWVFP